jgi:hypothetical protein
MAISFNIHLPGPSTPRCHFDAGAWQNVPANAMGAAEIYGKFTEICIWLLKPPLPWGGMGNAANIFFDSG